MKRFANILLILFLLSFNLISALPCSNLSIKNDDICNAVCPHKIGFSYCGLKCTLPYGHLGGHKCPHSHTWF